MALARGGCDVDRDMGGGGMADVVKGLVEALEWALECWDTHNESGDHMDGHWVSDAHAAIAAAQGASDAERAWEAAIEAAAFLAWDDEDEETLRKWLDWGEYRNMATAQTVAKEISTAIRALRPPAPDTERGA